MTKLSKAFAKNRTEEFPDDVYDKYVLPLAYEAMDISDATKACVIVGGRGSGKTMYLKYHCYPTIFSEKKDEKVDLNNIQNIGIYWRPDTSFTQHLSESWLGKHWASAFHSYMTLSLLFEFCGLMRTLLTSSSPVENKESVKTYALPGIISKSLINAKLHLKVIDAEEELRNTMFTLCNWINAPIQEVPPVRLDVKSTLDILISSVKEKIPELRHINYHVFIDEFENLTLQQQKIINTLMKHGRPPLIFSVAHKRNAEVSHETLSREKVVERNDFRTINLDEHYIKDFDIFAGEILMMRLAEHLHDQYFDEFMRNKSNTTQRNNPKYKNKIKDIGTTFLPSLSYKEIAFQIINSEVFMKHLKKLMLDGLKNFEPKKNPAVGVFIDKDFPEASIVNAVLLNRTRDTPAEILKEFEKYKLKQYSKYNSWIPNNLVGVILFLYKKTPEKPCPLYAGYEQYVHLSKGNIRHFLELCHQSVLKGEQNNILIEHALNPLPVEIQASATKRTSDLELEKISDLGAHGAHLKRLANRLGKIFSYSHSRKTQSEVEINHFTMDLSEHLELDSHTRQLLNEALIWSVLIDEDSTKSKAPDTIETKDYLLHPVLSAHFGISFRKKKKLKLSREEVSIIFTADDNKFNELLKKFGKNWGIDEGIELADIAKGEFGKQIGLL